MSDVAVHIEKVNFSYEKKIVLNQISMDIVQQRVCFLMGNNGSGKTTLLKNIMGFLHSSSGLIKLFCDEVNSLDKQTMSRRVSYVPQAISINTDFSVVDYLSLGRTPYLGTCSRLSDTDYSIIEKYAKRLGIDTLYNASFNKLSGGQKQMVAIARSLIQETPLIIMDEPMSALDIGKQVELLVVLQELVDEERTIILTTHNPNHALSIESDACFLKEGKIAAYGRSKEVIQNQMLRNIYGKNISLEHGELFDSVVFNTKA